MKAEVRTMEGKDPLHGMLLLHASWGVPYLSGRTHEAAVRTQDLSMSAPAQGGTDFPLPEEPSVTCTSAWYGN